VCLKNQISIFLFSLWPTLKKNAFFLAMNLCYYKVCCLKWWTFSLCVSIVCECLVVDRVSVLPSPPKQRSGPHEVVTVKVVKLFWDYRQPRISSFPTIGSANLNTRKSRQS
jgi:hypothetical protein